MSSILNQKNRIIYLKKKTDLKRIIKYLPKVLHFEELEDGNLKIITKEGEIMIKFENLKGEKKIGNTFLGIGEFIKTHEDGEHIKDWEYTGLFVGVYEPKNEKNSVVYFLNENGEVEKLTVWQIANTLVKGMKNGKIEMFDIVYIKYLGKERVESVDGGKKTVKYINKYDIKVYSGVENKDVVSKLLEKVKDEEVKQLIEYFNTLMDKPPF
ncbi:MAG: hypothetical protein JG759_412 [Thermoanaerobacter sp.]|nr:hypothetical protein [Thermoanaerobacter sp.]